MNYREKEIACVCVCAGGKPISVQLQREKVQRERQVNCLELTRFIFYSRESNNNTFAVNEFMAKLTVERKQHSI